MGKLNDLMEGRNQGIAFALKIAKEGGIEALEKEVEYRGLTNVSLNIPRKELEEATKHMRIRATEVSIVFAMITLLEEFSFSRMQALKFKGHFDEKVESILNEEETIQEYIRIIEEDYGITLVIRD